MSIPLHYETWLCRILGCMLLAAALLKAQQLATTPTVEAGLLTSRSLLFVVVQVELAWGAWLLMGLLPRYLRTVSLLGFGAMAGVSLARGVAGEATCGCFGQYSVSPWVSFSLSLTAIAALWMWRPVQRRTHVRLARALSLMSSWLITAVAAGLWMASFSPAALSAEGNLVGTGDVVLLEPEEWIGHEFPLRDHIDVGERLAEGNWTVVLYEPSCPKCHKVVAKYKTLSEAGASTPEVPGIALVTITSPESESTASEGKQTAWLRGRLDNEHKWFVDTPQVIRLDARIVMDVSKE